MNFESGDPTNIINAKFLVMFVVRVAPLLRICKNQ